MTETVAVFRELSARLGEDCVLTDPGRIQAYLTDWTGRFQGTAAAVLRPRTARDASTVVRACAAVGVSLVPQGGNTGLSAGATPDCTGRQAIISVERMTRIRSVDPVGQTIELDAGVILADAKSAAAAADVDRLLPISLGSEGSARIGGLVATNAGGADVLRYGQVRGLVLGLEAVLPDGEIYSALHHLRKNNTGFDFKQLFIGSEGRLGLITAAVLRLLPRPRWRQTALMSVSDLSTALKLLELFQADAGETLTAFELINGRGFAWSAALTGCGHIVGPAKWHLLIEFCSVLPEIEALAHRLFERAVECDLLQDGVIAQNERQQNLFWKVRENLAEGERHNGTVAKHDISVPIRNIRAFVEKFEEVVDAANTRALASIFGHLGNGNLHCNIIFPDGVPDVNLTPKVHDLAISVGGSITAEHGVGHYRWKEWDRLRPPVSRRFDRALKDACDPKNLFNPTREGGR
jgi:FAD/FMN-containing dehydrogenase